LWTASLDKTARHLVRSRDWAEDTVLTHPDFVRDVVVDNEGGWVITACRDEEVRVWDASSGKLACVYSGHYEEVTGLALIDAVEGQVGTRVVSVSIDGTVRVWSLDPAEIRRTREEADRAGEMQPEEDVKDEPKTSMLTAEEEAELADLMDDDGD
jgi:WD40 repeat protein